VLTEAGSADEDRWAEVERFGSHVLDTTFEGNRYVVVFSSARQRRGNTRRLQLIAEAKLLALENRVRGGDLVAATDIVAAAATIVARSPVKRLFDLSDVSQGRFVYDYNHDQLDYDEAVGQVRPLVALRDERGGSGWV